MLLPLGLQELLFVSLVLQEEMSLVRALFHPIYTKRLPSLFIFSIAETDPSGHSYCSENLPGEPWPEKMGG